MALQSVCFIKGISRLSHQALRTGILCQTPLHPGKPAGLSTHKHYDRSLLRQVTPCVLQAQLTLSSDSYRPKPPKKPLTSYFLFKKDQYPTLARNSPAVSVTQISKQISQMWKDLAHEERQRYMLAAEEERARYKQEMAGLSTEELQDIRTQADDRRKRRHTLRQKRKLKELNRPKHPPNQYNLYSQERLKYRGTIPPRDYMSKIAGEWKSLSEADRQPYFERARQLSLEYKETMLEWERKMVAEGHPEVVRGYRPPRPPRTPKRTKKVVKKKAKKPRKKAAAKKKSTKPATKDGKKKSSTAKKSSPKKDAEPEDVSWMREE